MEFNVTVVPVKHYEYNGDPYDDKNKLINQMVKDAVSEFDENGYDTVVRDLDTLIKNLQKIKTLTKTL